MSGHGGVVSPREVFIVAGEQSGDELGAGLILALRSTQPDINISGVGGPAMTTAGMASLFPMSDIAVMGFIPVIAKLPTLLSRIRRVADVIIASPPDILVIVDSPDFTHRVAKRVREALPDLPIIDYVSPTVWAWRPGRARKMRAYIDHVLALLPFEPAAHQRLGGPDCTYVGHPLIERLSLLRPSEGEVPARDMAAPDVLVLPGSRRSEVASLIDVFGATIEIVSRSIPNATFVLPAVAHLENEIRAKVSTWPTPIRVVTGDIAKFAAFRGATAALAASGTVTLELALAGIPCVVGYRVPWIEERIIRALATAPSFILSNIVLGENAVPGFLQRDCNPQTLAASLLPLLRESDERARQLAALAKIDGLMRLPNGDSPSGRAAQIIFKAAQNAKKPPNGGL